MLVIVQLHVVIADIIDWLGCWIISTIVTVFIRFWSVNPFWILETLFLGNSVWLLLSTYVLISLHLTNYTFMLEVLRLLLSLLELGNFWLGSASRFRRFLTPVVVFFQLFLKHLLLNGSLAEAEKRIGKDILSLQLFIKYLVIASVFQGGLRSIRMPWWITGILVRVLGWVHFRQFVPRTGNFILAIDILQLFWQSCRAHDQWGA